MTKLYNSTRGIHQLSVTSPPEKVLNSIRKGHNLEVLKVLQKEKIFPFYTSFIS